jgi:Uma2 family endonuclease
VGERDHGRLQLLLGAYFLARQEQWGTYATVEQRVQVSPERFRVPDVCIVLGKPPEQILTKPPFLCIEVLSSEDRMSRVEERIDDYLKMGVPHVWLIDPQTHRAYSATAATGLREVTDGVLRTENPAFEVPLAELFE